MDVLLDILNISKKGPKADPETEAVLKSMEEKFTKIKELEDSNASAQDIMNAMMK